MVRFSMKSKLKIVTLDQKYFILHTPFKNLPKIKCLLYVDSEKTHKKTVFLGTTKEVLVSQLWPTLTVTKIQRRIG